MDGTPNPESGHRGPQGNSRENVTPRNKLKVSPSWQLPCRLSQRGVSTQEPAAPQEVKTYVTSRGCALFILGLAGPGLPLCDWAWRKALGFVRVFYVSLPLDGCVIHPSSLLLRLAPDSTHGDLFLRHRQMGSSLESCSKLERGDCSFQERESCRSMRICSCSESHDVSGIVAPPQRSEHDVSKGRDVWAAGFPGR